MPIPFILGGIALAAGAYGVKKGIDAKDDFDTAETYNSRARRIYYEAQEKLEDKKSETNSSLEKLGSLKVSIYNGSLSDFVEVFEKIKNINFEDNLSLATLTNINNQDILDIKNTVLEMREVLGGGIAALGSGALAGFGALGGVGMLASASTGTAIASLSGAAATNATLAWLGGGSLAAGGGGMALGTAVLGGIVAGPVLAVGGMMMASKAEEAKYSAYENYDKAKAAAEQMDSACVVLDGIYQRSEELIYVLESLNKILEEGIDLLNVLILNSNDYSNYSEEYKKIVMIIASIAKTVKNICDAPVINKKGKVAKKSKKVLKKATNLLQQLEELDNVS